WDLNKESLPEKIIIPRALLRQGDNVILLQCYNHGGARGEAPLTVRHEVPAVQPVLRGPFLGVGGYDQAHPQQGQLSSKEGAEGLVDIWKRHKGKLYKDVKIADPLVDAAVTPDSVLQHLKAVAADPAIRPDDVFVFYLGGHGTRVKELTEKFKHLKK